MPSDEFRQIQIYRYGSKFVMTCSPSYEFVIKIGQICRNNSKNHAYFAAPENDYGQAGLYQDLAVETVKNLESQHFCNNPFTFWQIEVTQGSRSPAKVGL